MKPKRQKCGEMFRTLSGKNCFLCVECKAEFETTRGIIKHMNAQHFQSPELNEINNSSHNTSPSNKILVKSEREFNGENDFTTSITSADTSPLQLLTTLTSTLSPLTPPPLTAQEPTQLGTISMPNKTEKSENLLQESKTSPVNYYGEDGGGGGGGSGDDYDDNDDIDDDNDPDEYDNVFDDNKTGKMNDSTHFSCLICKKRITHKKRESHQRTHADDKPHKCKICTREYACKWTFNRHLRTHESNYQLPTCDYCQKSFPIKSRLIFHMQKHSGIRPFQCELCNNRGFPNRTYYEAHMRRHKNETPFQCSTCGKAFVSKISLNTHHRLHTEKKYKCDKCEKAFRRPKLLADHQKVIHSGIRSYTCEICGKAYGTKKNLGIHKMGHDEMPRFRCQFCAATFFHPSSKRKHEQRCQRPDFVPSRRRERKRRDINSDGKHEIGIIAANLTTGAIDSGVIGGVGGSGDGDTSSLVQNQDYTVANDLNVKQLVGPSTESFLFSS